MSISYDLFTGAFLDKITEYDFIQMAEHNRQAIIDGYMKRAFSQFNKICAYSLVNYNDETRELLEDVATEDIDELVDIVSEGMVAQWMRPMTYKIDNLEVALNTTDFSGYSPAEVMKQVKAVYEMVDDKFINMMREYSYNHGDLGELHL